MAEQYRILLVEDDECIRKLTAMHLKMNSFENVYAVGNAESAWLLAKRIHPDVILLDVMLPGIDGLTLLKKFRKSEEFKNTPVIIITSGLNGLKTLNAASKLCIPQSLTLG